ncbi:acetyltransferase [Vibrio cholerae]|nr:acetyltransferase [Vibrio cholerae]
MQLLCLSLVVMRCQPLRRALGNFVEYYKNVKVVSR